MVEPAKSIELQSLRRLKEALVVSEARRGKPRMIAAKDWLAELDTKIAAIERGLGLESRPGD